MANLINFLGCQFGFQKKKKKTLWRQNLAFQVTQLVESLLAAWAQLQMQTSLSHIILHFLSLLTIILSVLEPSSTLCIWFGLNLVCNLFTFQSKHQYLPIMSFGLYLLYFDFNMKRRECICFFQHVRYSVDKQRQGRGEEGRVVSRATARKTADPTLKCTVKKKIKNDSVLTRPGVFISGFLSSPLQKPAPQPSAGQTRPLLVSWQPSLDRCRRRRHPPSARPTASHPLTFPSGWRRWW